MTICSEEVYEISLTVRNSKMLSDVILYVTIPDIPDCKNGFLVSQTMPNRQPQQVLPVGLVCRSSKLQRMNCIWLYLVCYTRINKDFYTPPMVWSLLLP